MHKGGCTTQSNISNLEVLWLNNKLNLSFILWESLCIDTSDMKNFKDLWYGRNLSRLFIWLDRLLIKHKLKLTNLSCCHLSERIRETFSLYRRFTSLFLGGIFHCKAQRWDPLRCKDQTTTRNYWCHWCGKISWKEEQLVKEKYEQSTSWTNKSIMQPSILGPPHITKISKNLTSFRRISS